ncbi:1-aminocyclopropane-1-carboxylate oxidase homolog 3-like protein [Tanacetum coccineum]
MSPMEPAWDMVSEMCKVSLANWDKAVVDLAEELMSILCEGLGIKSDKLKELSCLEGRVKCGEEWADVEAVPSAIVSNIGDVLQMMSNDEYKSVQHRVLANPIKVNLGDISSRSRISDLEKISVPNLGGTLENTPLDLKGDMHGQRFLTPDLRFSF